MRRRGRQATCVGNKSQYRSRRAAKAGATAVAMPNGDRRMAPYYCRDHHCWHLTSKRTRSI